MTTRFLSAALVVMTGAAFLSGPAPAAEPGPAPRLLAVGPDRPLRTPSAAAAVARNGDTVVIDAGDYVDDFAVWRQDGLTLRAAGGPVRLRARNLPGNETDGIWIVRGNDTTVEGISFAGARSTRHNGAGIRVYGRNLVVRRCDFRGNQMGLLTARNPDSEITVERSVFVGNTIDYERTGWPGHQIYVSAVRRFTLRFSYLDAPAVGHNVKSRARENFILYNRIVDGPTGSGSYLIDLPNGGAAVVMGNELHKSARAENEAAIAYAAEGELHPGRRLFVVNNTFVNARLLGVFVRNFSVTTVAHIANNIVSGPAVLSEGLSNPVRNLQAGPEHFVDLAGGDMRLSGRPGAVDTGVALAPVDGMALRPESEYRHPADGVPRAVVNRMDLGAHEYAPH